MITYLVDQEALEIRNYGFCRKVRYEDISCKLVMKAVRQDRS